MFELLFVHPWWAYRSGKLAFASAWPRWALLIAIVLAVLVVMASLWRRRHLGLARVALIGGLQATLAALILCLLWRPVLNVERVRDQQNVLAIALDNSTSMAATDAGNPNDENAPTRLQTAVAALQDGPLAELAKTFELRFFAFDKSATPIADAKELPASGAQSRIGDSLKTIMQTAGSAPLAGVVLVSDGAETGQSLSEAQFRELKAYGVPIHAIGVGPERLDNDLELDSVDVPMSVAPNTMVAAEIGVRHSVAQNAPKEVRLRVYDGDTLLASREIKLGAQTAATGSGYVSTASVEFPSGEAGVRDLRFSLDALANESNTINNTRRAVLNVPSARRSILYIEGEPRWEFKFIRRAVEGERSLRLASVVRTTQNKFYRQGVSSAEELSGGFPTTAEELFAYDAIIIGSYEAVTLSVAQHQLLKDFVDRRGGGLLMLGGRFGLGEGGWATTPLANALPTHLSNKRDASSKQSDFRQLPVQAALTEYGSEFPALRFDADPKKNLEQWATLPMLANVQTLGALKPGAVVLLETPTHEPLLVWQRYGRGRTFVLATASTQRWQMSLPAEDQRHEIFWRQLLHAVADQAPSAVQLHGEQAVYADESSVRLTAVVRDANFEPATDAQVELWITPEAGEPMSLTMVSDTAVLGLGNEPANEGRYAVAFDTSKPGLYRADLTARMPTNKGANKGSGKDTDRVLTGSTAFRRDDNIVEHFGSYLHRAVLERLARETDGRYWPLDNLSALAQAIPYSKSGIVERQMLDLWNLPIVFLVLFALKLGEWWARIKWGTL